VVVQVESIRTQDVNAHAAAVLPKYVSQSLVNLGYTVYEVVLEE
jgi:hypothetical protein